MKYVVQYHHKAFIVLQRNKGQQKDGVTVKEKEGENDEKGKGEAKEWERERGSKKKGINLIDLEISLIDYNFLI